MEISIKKERKISKILQVPKVLFTRFQSIFIVQTNEGHLTSSH